MTGIITVVLNWETLLTFKLSGLAVGREIDKKRINQGQICLLISGISS